MTIRKNRTILIGAVVIVIVVAAGYTMLQSGNKEEEEEPSIKILFVGATLTDVNKGFYYHIEKLASSADPPLVIKADKIITRQTPLEGQWKNTNARNMIENGDYDAVVLQEELHWTFIETFHEYSREFDALIKESGAETVLLMSYAYECPDAQGRARIQGDVLGYASIDVIMQAHRDIEEELDCKVAPFGLAFHHVLNERPDLDLYDSENRRPSIYGTYLGVNVVYTTVFDESPEGLTYKPEGVNEDDALYLQRIAWETVQKYRAQ